MVADTVWKALGGVTTYVEPFAGSCAVLLARPQPFTGLEIINDANGFVCLAPSTKLLGGDLRWKEAGNVQVGDVLVGFDEHNGTPQTEVPRRADRPTFQPPTRMRRWRTTKVTNVQRVTRPSYRLVFEDGTEVVASEDHLWLAGKSKAGGRGARWISTKNLLAGPNHRTHVMKLCDVTDQEETAEGGWLGGFYDGEGHIRGKGPGWGLSVCQKVGPEAERVKALLHTRGFDIRESIKNGKGRHQDVISFEINGGMREILRFLMLARPERLIRNALAVLNARSIYGRERQVVGLVEKHFLGPTEVMAIETESHTFVAEGLASHNCNFWRAVQQSPDEVAAHADHPALECVPTGTMIDTPRGPVPVEQIVPGMVVWGEVEGRTVPTVVRAIQRGEAREFIRIGDLRVTSNHPIKTLEHGYVRAGDLRPGLHLWKIRQPTLEYDLVVLQSPHGQTMGDLRAGGSENEPDPVRGSDRSGEATAQRAPFQSGDRREDPSRLLDSIPHHTGTQTCLQGAGTGCWRGMAGSGEVLDLGTPTDGGSGQSYGWGGRDSRVPSFARAPGEMVCDAKGRSVCSWTGGGDEGETPPPGGSGEDRSSWQGEEAHRSNPQEDVRSRENSRNPGYDTGSSPCFPSETGGVCRDGGNIRFRSNSCQNPQGGPLIRDGIHSQGCSLQREPLQVWVKVHNFETDTGNYFAEGVLVHNCDLHARHLWLWERRDQLQQKLEGDPDWCDPKIAGWWLWGMSNFFTGAWCVQKPNRCKLITNQQGVMASHADPYRWMDELQTRLRRVRVLCGDFKRALTTSVVGNYESQTNVTGVFLDPPYDGGDQRVYGGLDGNAIFNDTLNWAVANASPKVRVVLAGYDSRPMPEGWSEVRWKGHGGHGRRRDNGENTNSDRERLWLSPGCFNPQAQPMSLDDLLGT